ncbi:MAG: zinc ABC transporter substrate-binding protein [Pontiella sp.]
MKNLFLILISALFIGCADQEHVAPSDKPLVFVSIPPQAGLLRAIAGDQLDIRTLAGEGQSPHAYEPTARQLTALSKADLLFTIGIPFEKSLLNKIKPLYPELTIIETDAQIIKRTMPHAHHGEHCDHEHGAKDPHVWLSPRHALVIASTMYETLQQRDPDNLPLYLENFNQLTEKLEQLHSDTTEQIAPYKNSRFYVFHPSYGYFADQYDLEQVPIELDGKAPSPRQLADLIEQAQTDGVKVIFVSKQFPKGSANAVAKAIGGRVVQLDPLAEDVVANLRKIAESIVLELEP